MIEGGGGYTLFDTASRRLFYLVSVVPSQIPLPSDVPLLPGMTLSPHKPIHGILKKHQT